MPAPSRSRTTTRRAPGSRQRVLPAPRPFNELLKIHAVAASITMSALARAVRVHPTMLFKMGVARAPRREASVRRTGVVTPPRERVEKLIKVLQMSRRDAAEFRLSAALVGRDDLLEVVRDWLRAPRR